MDHLLNHSMCVNNHLQLDGEFDFVQVSGLVLSFLGFLLVGVYILRYSTPLAYNPHDHCSFSQPGVAWWLKMQQAHSTVLILIFISVWTSKLTYYKIYLWGGHICLDFWTAFSVFIVNCYCIKFQATFTETVSVLITSCTCGAELCHTTPHPLSEVTNILHPLALVILTSSQICSHWLTQSQKEADIYYLFIIGWHTINFSYYWLNILN